MAKYNTLEQLRDAFVRGELKGWILRLDNDSTSLDWQGGPPEGIEPDSDAGAAFEDQKYEEGHKLYAGGNGYSDLDEAMRLAGIPCSWC